MKKINNKKDKSLSSSDKKGDLLIQVDDLMNQLENDPEIVAILDLPPGSNIA